MHEITAEASAQTDARREPTIAKKNFILQNYVRWLMLLLCATALTASAQYRTSIQGVVTDTTGAVIPGATLTLTNNATNEKQVRTSDAGGVYNFNALPPDTFTLVVTKDQFQEKDLVNLKLIPEQANSINVQMEPGVATQTVTVDASTQPALDTETANTQTSISANQIEHMPVYQRDPTSLIRLAPGALSDGAQAAGGGGFQAPGTQTGASSGGRQPRAFQQYLRHGKRPIGQRERRPVRE